MHTYLYIYIHIHYVYVYIYIHEYICVRLGTTWTAIMGYLPSTTGLLWGFVASYFVLLGFPGASSQIGTPPQVYAT